MVAGGASPSTCDYVDIQNNRSMFLHPVAEEEVITVIKNIKKKNSYSCKIEGLQMKPVKHVYHIHAPILLRYLIDV